MKLAMIGAGRMGGTIVQMLKKDSGTGWKLEVLSRRCWKKLRGGCGGEKIPIC